MTAPGKTGSPNFFPFAFDILQSGANLLADNVALKFGDGADHVKDQLAGRRRSTQAVLLQSKYLILGHDLSQPKIRAPKIRDQNPFLKTPS